MPDQERDPFFENEPLDGEAMGALTRIPGPQDSALDSVILGGGAMQQVRTGFTTAVTVQKPRVITAVTACILSEARLAKAAFFYRWEVKDKKTSKKKEVIGPSIDLAMCMLRNWGNAACPTEMYETKTHYIFRATFVDLETGMNVDRLFRQRKGQNIGGKYDVDRAEDMVFQIGQSKAQRNVIAKAMPIWLTEQAITEAREAEVKGLTGENLPIARAKVIDFFGRYGITPDRIEKSIGRDSDHWTPDDIANLRGSATALKDGHVSADDLFPDPNARDSAEASDLTEKLRAKRKPKEAEAMPATIPCPDLDGRDVPAAECAAKPCRDGCPSWPKE